jgi:hypothetical protein
MQRVGLQGGKGYDATGNREGAGSQGHDASPDCQVNWCNAVIDMAYRRGDNDRPEVLGYGFIEATTWGEGMSGDHNMYQKGKSYLDFECPRREHCRQNKAEEHMIRKAMQQALDMLNEIADDVYYDEKLKEAITALEQALEAERNDLAKVGEVGVWGDDISPKEKP